MNKKESHEQQFKNQNVYYNMLAYLETINFMEVLYLYNHVQQLQLL